ncbi:hypothetical protein ARMGADRAFT_1107264 [Armillaria gallica]|uniref:Uncharacterized protein n=1 Tax=Armillaria gallica TaxID=47427 RepID=A0A2H3E282_ARMGA|nr:hypothetical protein ARMGADRAFT_1107264 [Armillaria gallica]
MEKVAYKSKLPNSERAMQTRERLKEADAIEEVTSRKVIPSVREDARSMSAEWPIPFGRCRPRPPLLFVALVIVAPYQMGSRDAVHRGSGRGMTPVGCMAKSRGGEEQSERMLRGVTLGIWSLRANTIARSSYERETQKDGKTEPTKSSVQINVKKHPDLIKSYLRIGTLNLLRDGFESTLLQTIGRCMAAVSILPSPLGGVIRHLVTHGSIHRPYLHPGPTIGRLRFIQTTTFQSIPCMDAQGGPRPSAKENRLNRRMNDLCARISITRLGGERVRSVGMFNVGDEANTVECTIIISPQAKLLPSQAIDEIPNLTGRSFFSEIKGRTDGSVPYTDAKNGTGVVTIA